jgi:hypothetical protein
MAEETRSGAARRPTLQEGELAEQHVKSWESRLIADELRAYRGEQRVHGPSYAVARTVAEAREELQRLLAAREARQILVDSDTVSYSRGPLSIECDLAREMGWTQEEIERAAQDMNDRASLNNERGAKRQGRTMRCVHCEQWVKPPEPCAMPSAGVCTQCADSLADSDGDRPIAPAAPPKHPSLEDLMSAQKACETAEHVLLEWAIADGAAAALPLIEARAKLEAISQAIYPEDRPQTPDIATEIDSTAWHVSPEPRPDWTAALAEVRGTPAKAAPELEPATEKERTAVLAKLLERKRAAVVALEKVKTAERELVAAGLSTIPTGGVFTEGAYAQGVVYGKALRLAHVQTALASCFHDNEIAEARTARAMGLASTLLLAFAKTAGLSSARQHRAAVLADWLKLGAPEAFDPTTPAVPDDLFSSDILVHLEAVCPDGHALSLVAGPITYWIPLVGPPRDVVVVDDQRAHVYCLSTAATPVGCGKPLTLRLRFEVVKSRWQDAT